MLANLYPYALVHSIIRERERDKSQRKRGRDRDREREREKSGEGGRGEREREMVLLCIHFLLCYDGHISQASGGLCGLWWDVGGARGF